MSYTEVIFLLAIWTICFLGVQMDKKVESLKKRIDELDKRIEEVANAPVHIDIDYVDESRF